jgi:hypothetical protein
MSRETGEDTRGAILWQQHWEYQEWKNGKTKLVSVRKWIRGLWAGQHRYMLPFIMLLFAVSFAGFGIALALTHKSAELASAVAV